MPPRLPPTGIHLLPRPRPRPPIHLSPSPTLRPPLFLHRPPLLFLHHPPLLLLHQPPAHPSANPSTHPSTHPSQKRPYSTTHPPSSPTPSPLQATRLPAPHTGSILLLTLHNPRTRNAISHALLAALSEPIAAIAAEGAHGDTRCVVLASGLHNAFCAGADLKERAGFTAEETTTFLTTLRTTLTSLSTLPIPTITALSSLALGGGLELALATTLRILTPSARLALPETRLGIIPGAGGTYRLPALIGRARAAEMMLSARRLTGREAYAWGLGERFVDPDGNAARETTGEEEEVGNEDGAEERAEGERIAGIEAALALAREVCQGAPLAIRAVVGCLGRGAEAESEAYAAVVGTRDRDEALLAFREKRRAVFTGR